MTLDFAAPGATVGTATLILAPLGVPLRVHCAAGKDAIAAACRGWEGRAIARSAPVHLKVGLSSGLSGTNGTEIQATGTSLTLDGPGATGRAEVERGSAWCSVSEAYLGDPGALRHDVLEPLVLMLLTGRDRTPLHAAAFVAQDTAILLAGRSGAGKSCLARAADGAGLQVLSDDTVYVQLEPHLSVWGWPTAAHLLAGDAPHDTSRLRWRNGKLKRVIPLRSASTEPIACSRAVLCVLSATRFASPSLHQLTSSEVDQRMWPLDEGFDLLPGPIARALAHLLRSGAWELRLSTDPREAIRLLLENLPQLLQAGPQG